MADFWMPSFTPMVQRRAEFLDRMTRMTISICTSLGFTTGIDDEDLPPEAKEEISKINQRGSDAVDVELEKFGKDGRRYETRPGRTPLETLEENILMILDEAKTESGNVAKSFLGSDNVTVMMATSGARGSMDNLAMMAGSIGQPKVRGKRLERGISGQGIGSLPKKFQGSPGEGFRWLFIQAWTGADRILHAICIWPGVTGRYSC